MYPTSTFSFGNTLNSMNTTFIFKFGEVIKYDPEIALFAGRDGLEAYRRIIPSLTKFLNPDGFAATNRSFPDKSFTIFASMKPNAFIIFLT